jgi:hypothetical protein
MTEIFALLDATPANDVPELIEYQACEGEEMGEETEIVLLDVMRLHLSDIELA